MKKRILLLIIIGLTVITGFDRPVLKGKTIFIFGDFAMAEDFSKPTKKDKSFKTMEKVIKGKNHVLKYYMYEKPEEIKLIPLNQTKRNTAKDTLISSFSYLMQSDNRNEIMDHSLECKRIDKVIDEIGWAEYLKWNRDYYNKRRAEIIGKALYKKHIVYIVRFSSKEDDSFSEEITGYFFKKIDNKYYSDNDSAADDLFLQALDGYEWNIEKVKDLKEPEIPFKLTEPIIYTMMLKDKHDNDVKAKVTFQEYNPPLEINQTFEIEWKDLDFLTVEQAYIGFELWESRGQYFSLYHGTGKERIEEIYSDRKEFGQNVKKEREANPLSENYSTYYSKCMIEADGKKYILTKRMFKFKNEKFVGVEIYYYVGKKWKDSDQFVEDFPHSSFDFFVAYKKKSTPEFLEWLKE